MQQTHLRCKQGESSRRAMATCGLRSVRTRAPAARVITMALTRAAAQRSVSRPARSTSWARTAAPPSASPPAASLHAPFCALAAYVACMAAAPVSSDWWLDFAAAGTVWGAAWVACARLRPSPRTVGLLNLLPLAHLAGARGLYSWSLGNLSWDVIVHTSSSFTGTLLFASVLADMSAARARQPAAAAAATPALLLLLAGLLLAGTALVEGVEQLGGSLAGQGEGMFLRGPGDFCTLQLPCSEATDTAKDMVDNAAGVALALLALAAGGSGAPPAQAGQQQR